jgi:hypothetical protein
VDSANYSAQVLRCGYEHIKHMRGGSLMRADVHCAPQMLMARENERNFLALEYLKVATLRAVSSQFIPILPAFRTAIEPSAQFEFSIPIASACGLDWRSSQVLHLSSWFHCRTRPYVGPFPALIISSAIFRGGRTPFSRKRCKSGCRPEIY